MFEIFPRLYQFSAYIPPMDFTLHQYLYAAEPAILFATGTAQQAERIAPKIREILGEKELRYIFASHMESDEIGGLSVFQKLYPNVTVICGALAARELDGYGFSVKTRIVKGGDTLTDGELSFRFIDYPSEVHDQNGLVFFEENSGIVYSADLFLRYGNGSEKTITADFEKEVLSVSAERVVCADKRAALQQALLQRHPKFVAVGHGFCIRCNVQNNSI